MATTTVCCALPQGLLLGYTTAPNGTATVPVALAGAPYTPFNPGPVTAGFSEIDSTFWTAWKASPAAAPILAAGAVWEA